ncbi:chemotaxis response regulator protein-glutamate methylesterase [Fictibacillus sp. Mic-4]|uniref:protein-glutamate methylesterase/protein-glutamine glutaminase n=1 Tax=Fictibacillus TaxID=1329200 RepID=UPI00041BB94D|nr:chemotaxis response regulator protein-glutamate methylesterase [Fictibacillus gelatini]
MAKIRVLVVDDSAFMRKLISTMLASDERIEVVGTARDGEDALKKVKELKPQCLTLDVEMPIMDGLQCLRILMKTTPLPVIMLSSMTKAGADHTIQAMELGAIDFVAKPSGSISLDIEKVKAELIEKVVLAAKVKLNRRPQIMSPMKKVERFERPPCSLKKIVLIGTSTGGPKALQVLLSKLPETLNAPLLIVQHMPPGFTRSLAERLNTLSELTVKEAEHGESIQNNVAYIAPGGKHMKVAEDKGILKIELSEDPPALGHRPAVNVLFDSAAHLTGFSKVAVVMTGMGVDGASGIINLKRQRNCITIAESEESSVIYGMPKAAVKTGKIDHIAHLENLASCILNNV